MDKLKEYIEQNLDKIDIEEPNEGHFDRFVKKLKVQEPITVRRQFSQWFVAASIIILFSIITYFSLTSIIDSSKYTLARYSNEMEETEWYFNTQIDIRYSKIKELSKTSNISFQMLQSDLNEMDTYYASLQKDLSNNPQDERIINAMINYYKNKIDLLDRIIDQTYELAINDLKTNQL